MENVGAPMVLAGGEVALQGGRQFRQVEIEMLGGAKLETAAAGAGARLDKLSRVEQAAAVVALIAAGVGGVAGGGSPPIPAQGRDLAKHGNGSPCAYW